MTTFRCNSLTLTEEVYNYLCDILFEGIKDRSKRVFKIHRSGYPYNYVVRTIHLSHKLLICYPESYDSDSDSGSDSENCDYLGSYYNYGIPKTPSFSYDEIDFENEEVLIRFVELTLPDCSI